MIRRAVQWGVKDAAPDLTPEPRRDTPDERSIVNDPSACRSCWNGTAACDGLCAECLAFFSVFTSRPGEAS